MNRKEFNSCLKRIENHYPKEFILTEELIFSFYRALQQYDVSTVYDAITNYFDDEQQGKFAPKPAHIREKIIDLITEKPYRLFKESINMYHDRMRVRFQDKKINYVIRELGGWKNIHYMKKQSNENLERLFKKFYAHCQEKDCFMSLPAHDVVFILDSGESEVGKNVIQRSTEEEAIERAKCHAAYEKAKDDWLRILK